MIKYPCPSGYYCRNGEKIPCAAGSYGSKKYLTEERCEGKCLPGYFCPLGSTHNRQHECGGRNVFCPEGAKSPKSVSTGFYSYNSSLVEGVDVDTGMTMSWQKECEVGYYCTEGKKHACPPGTYGYLKASKTRNECAPCRSGFYCPSEPDRPTKVGEQIPCGVSHHFCPHQSAAPLTVSIGYYSLGNNSTLFRTKQEICPKGCYCENGMKYACPPGTFGQSTGEISKACSGFCPEGKYCEEGTIEPVECEENSYAAEGWSKCVPCNNKELREGRTRCKSDRNCCNQ